MGEPPNPDLSCSSCTSHPGLEQRKIIFINTVTHWEDLQHPFFSVLTRIDYEKLLDEVKSTQTNSRLALSPPRRLRKYSIKVIGGVERLVTSETSQPKIYLPLEDIFDLLERKHSILGHCASDKLKAEIPRKYANISKEITNVFLSTCVECKEKVRLV